MRSQTVSTKLQRIAKQAKQNPNHVFTNLMHLIDVDFLHVAYDLTRKDGASGIDGMTAKEYAENLEGNLNNLLERMKSGKYFAPPVKRVWIDKEDGKQRPLGITTFEDKVVQRAVVMLLSAVYEHDFYDFSHGFRPHHSAHHALHEVRERCRLQNIQSIVDADVSGYFDNIDHELLRQFIKRRVNDGTLIRFVGKWLNAGVMDGKSLSYPVQGTPQGGVISPMLANIFLHNVLDDWFVKEVSPRMRARCFIVRYADDFIIGCESQSDANRIMEVLPKRFNRFKLTIHPQKTKLVTFAKPSYSNQFGKENETFDFLGFTHYWAKSRRGYWVIKKKTMKKRLRRSVKAIWDWCRINRHKPLPVQHRTLCQKLEGHYQYYGVTGNYKAMAKVAQRTTEAWNYWLSRRSHKSYINWDGFKRLLAKFPLSKPHVNHAI